MTRYRVIIIKNPDDVCEFRSSLDLEAEDDDGFKLALYDKLLHVGSNIGWV